MNDYRPEFVYTAVVFAILSLVIWAGIIDISLYLSESPTVSQWLRDNPRWYCYPLAAVLTFLGLLTVHLFGAK